MNQGRFWQAAQFRGRASTWWWKTDMGKPARWIAIIASLFLACAAHAATTRKHVVRSVHSRSARPRSPHAAYRTARYARQSNSRASHAKPKPRHSTRSRRHYRRRRYYHRRVRLPRAPSRERITQIQSALARGGYYQGQPSGKWDSTTVAAVQKFQSSNNIDATGKLDAPTLQKLGLGSDIAGVAAPKPVLPPNCCSTGPAASSTAAPARAVDSANPPSAASTPAPHEQPVSATSAGSPVPAAPRNSADSKGTSPAPAAAPGAAGTSDPSPASKPASPAQH
jgi:peptidoglycan hydrolase-like protein with peptidoglycan-binding domain